MIKFFRKIRKNLLIENKTGKYFKYAIGEIVLVVIGILIALQINNWNQERLEGKKEQIVLKQLYSDFEANDSIIKKGFKTYKTLLAINSVIIRNTGPNVLVPKDSVTKDSLNRLFYPKVNLVNNSLTISSQQLDVVTNNGLKVILSKFPSIYRSYQEIENEIKNHTIEQRIYHKKYISVITLDSDFNQENFKSDFLELYRNRDYQNVTLDKRWNLQNGLLELQRLDNQNLLIIELIKKEIKV